MPEFLWQRSESGLRRALLSPLVLAEGLYRAGAALHRAAYERGVRRRERLPVRVVSVGNLAVGGSGKTPVVAWLGRVAEAFYYLHTQDKSCWTHELQLTPFSTRPSF